MRCFVSSQVGLKSIDIYIGNMYTFAYFGPSFEPRT